MKPAESAVSENPTAIAVTAAHRPRWPPGWRVRRSPTSPKIAPTSDRQQVRLSTNPVMETQSRLARGAGAYGDPGAPGSGGR